MLLRSVEPPNLTFPVSMLSIRIASMPFRCCFEASNLPIFHSWPVCYLYVLPVCHLHALRSFEPPNLPFPACMLSIRIASMPFTCCFEPPNLPFLAIMLSIHIASMLFRCCFEASNLPIFHSRPVCYLYVLPVCYLDAASKLRTSQSSIPSQYAIYTYCQYAIYMLLRTSQSSIPGHYAIYTYCQYAIYMPLRTS